MSTEVAKPVGPLQFCRAELRRRVSDLACQNERLREAIERLVPSPPESPKEAVQGMVSVGEYVVPSMECSLSDFSSELRKLDEQISRLEGLL